jgi:polyhydroxyalkanoate synthesis regulator phasin
MKAMMGMMAVPGKVQTFTQEQIDKIAKSMNLATEEEVKELRRTIRRLEDEMRRMNKKA